MKNSRFWTTALALALTACQADDLLLDEVVTDADEANYTLTLSSPEAMETTRTYTDDANSAFGGLRNVDMDDYDLRYQLAVYRVDTDDDGNASYTLVIAPKVQTVPQYQSVTYSLRLTPNRKYQFVAWADFVIADTETDLHYDTGTIEDGSWLITCLDGIDEQLNDESRDAYTATKQVSISENGNTTLTLKRPFAKVRLISTDWNYGTGTQTTTSTTTDDDGNETTKTTETTIAGLEMPNKFLITYYDCERFTNINLVDGTSESSTLATSESTIYVGTIDRDNKDYVEDYDSDDGMRTLTVDYLMTHITDQSQIHFNFKAYYDSSVDTETTEEATEGDDSDDDTSTNTATDATDVSDATLINEVDFVTDIPIQRNYLTTILGNLLTTGTDCTIVCDDTWAGGYYYPEQDPEYEEVATLAELELALQVGAQNIRLTADIPADGETATKLYVYSPTQNIDLNENTLTVTSIEYYTDDTTAVAAASSDDSSSDESDSDEEVDWESGLTISNGTIKGNSYCVRPWGSNAILTIDEVEMTASLAALVVGSLDYNNEKIFVKVKDSYLESTSATNTQYAAVSVQCTNSKIFIEGSEIICENYRGISNMIHDTTPGGITLSVTDTKITAKNRCLYLVASDEVDYNNLTVKDCEFILDADKRGVVVGVCRTNIEIDGAGLTNMVVREELTGNSAFCIYLGETIDGAINSDSTWSYISDPYEGSVSLSDITYNLASSEGNVWPVAYYEGSGKLVNYSEVGDIGATKVTYNYTETSSDSSDEE